MIPNGTRFKCNMASGKGVDGLDMNMKDTITPVSDAELLNMEPEITYVSGIGTLCCSLH